MKARKMSEASTVPLIAIRAEVLLGDPDTCKFTASQTVHPGGPFFFDGPERAAGSPLPEALFGLPGIAHVLVAENVVTVGKVPEIAWPQLKGAIGTKIRTQMLTGVPAILEATFHAPHPTSWGRSDEEVRSAIQKVLDDEVNRGIAGHGGRISLVDYQAGKLRIAMTGGCQGCASSQVTLRQGVEVMVRRIAPEVVEIVDTTDHAAGKKPFYQRPG
jgi:Fe-S cluster biogenesis protein NfuA